MQLALYVELFIVLAKVIERVGLKLIRFFKSTVGKSTKSVMASEATERCFLIVRVSNVLNVLESIVFYLKNKVL